MEAVFNIWVAEYSPEQQTVHVDTLERILAMNHQIAEGAHNPGFIPLYVAASQEDASAYIERWRCEHGG